MGDLIVLLILAVIVALFLIDGARDLRCRILGHRADKYSLRLASADQSAPPKFIPMICRSAIDPGYAVYPCRWCHMLITVPRGEWEA